MSIDHLSGHQVLLVILINWYLFKDHSQRLIGMHYLSYTERLKALGLELLESRRPHAHLIMCYKIVHGLVRKPSESLFELHLQQENSWSLFCPDSHVNVRAHGFPV